MSNLKHGVDGADAVAVGIGAENENFVATGNRVGLAWRAGAKVNEMLGTSSATGVSSYDLGYVPLGQKVSDPLKARHFLDDCKKTTWGGNVFAVATEPKGTNLIGNFCPAFFVCAFDDHKGVFPPATNAFLIRLSDNVTYSSNMISPKSWMQFSFRRGVMVGQVPTRTGSDC
jgi:hypothetical protein